MLAIDSQNVEIARHFCGGGLNAMRLLLDTQAALWAFIDSPRLQERARA
jgi:hypothetical protein